MQGRSDVWVIVPAYNEGGAISDVLRMLAESGYTVVVVDDGSSDDTVQRALHFPVIVLRHLSNLGQGAALQTGITYALRSRAARFIVTFDSDGQHHVEDIDRLLAPLRSGNYDVALGSRFLRENDTAQVPLRRRVMLRLVVSLSRVATRLPLTDAHNGLRAFTADAARQIEITHNRMAHASEIVSQIAALKLRYCEVPVTITYSHYATRKGQTVFHGVDILWDLVRGNIR
jgi:glycosyltransferase involved in cell wall biosynthesis